MNKYEVSIKENNKYFTGISILYGVIFAFCMYKNLFGWTFLIYAIATVLVLHKFLEKVNAFPKKETKFFFAGVILCGMSTCLTANIFLQFLNWCCLIVLLMALMINQLNEKSNFKLSTYIEKLIKVLFKTIGSMFLPLITIKNEIKIDKKKRNIDKEKWKMIFAGGSMAVCVLVVVVPLLASSDIIFENILKKIFSWLSFDGFYSLITNFETLLGIFFTFIAGFLLIYAFFYASCHVNEGTDTELQEKKHKALSGIVFSFSIASVYLLYSIVQIRYLFMRAGLPEGLTYSEYAHSGFWQLVLVVVINVCMVMICSEIYEKNKYLQGIITLISLCTYVMIFSAAYRMQLYISVYYMTFLRLVVLCFLAVVSLIMAGVIISIYREKFPIAKYIIAVTAGSYLLFSFSQPDYWIAKYNVKHIEQLSCADLGYMMYSLSVDAAPVIAKIDPSQVSSEDGYGCTYYYDNVTQDTAEIMMQNYFQKIKHENENISFRKVNFSRIRAKRIAGSF